MRSIIPQIARDGERIPDGEGVYFNGETARPYAVRLFVDHVSGKLQLRGAEVDLDWPLRDVRLVPDQAGQRGLVLGCESQPLARLLSADRDLARQFPNLNKRRANVSRGKLAKWAVGAVASVALIILVLVPLMADQLARIIPPEGEHALGEATLEHIRSALNKSDLEPLEFCENPAGIAALNKIENKLTATDRPLTVRILDHDMVNAFALPGGHIVFFRGLIDAAETPEELAAVFAHEMGHVVSRDPTRHALRSAGSIGILGLLFGDFAGGAMVLLLTEQLIEARYSQKAEADADAFAYDVLMNAGVPPSALGDMFATFLDKFGETKGVHSHFLSHPQLSDRIAAAERATPESFVAMPLLTAEEWSALKGVCQ